MMLCLTVLWLLCSGVGLRGQETTTDGNDCFSQPCLNGGTCVDEVQSYRCECPRNFNGTNCEQDLASEFGCAVSPCENNGTCQDVSNPSPGALPYQCLCHDGFAGLNCERLLDQCEKSPRPCGLGTCTSSVNSYTCNCTGTGFRGRNCSEDINECLEGSPCSLGQCYNRPGGYSCQCPPGTDGPLCQDIDECESSPCQNGGTCTQGNNTYTCSCVGGYDGVNCEVDIDDCANVTCTGEHRKCVDGLMSHQCVCQDGYEENQGECTDINECDSQPCEYGATCLNEVNAYSCVCVPGYSGNNCETNIDECAAQPCQNNASCSDGVNSFTCHCLPGFTSDNCSVDIDDCVNHNCLNGATCQDMVNGFTCQCVDGWEGDDCGDNIDDCLGSPCENNATCNDFVANYTCTCLTGFTGGRCETNIDDCDPDPCENGGTCVDGVNDYHCNCTSPWMGKNCSEQYDACSFSPCLNGATCLTTIPQREYTCTCALGYTGYNCETDIDDCQGNDCQSYEQCYDGINVYTCACPTGFTGDQCGQDIDECASSPCQNGGTCHNMTGFYNCSCLVSYDNKYRYAVDGYKGYNCEEDINECQYDPPICQNGGTCENLHGSYQCRCIGETADGLLITGRNCQVSTTYCLVSGGNPCQNGGTCRNSKGTYACDCVPGFTGKNCSININECASSPCQFNGTCVDGINGYNCTCIPGITGPNCETNINDCSDNPCGPGICKDLINDFECNCTDTGFSGANCTDNIDDCLPGICQHNGTCVDGIKNYTCDCQQAYTGRNCEQDIQECASSPCQYNGTCLEFSNITLYDGTRSNFTVFSYSSAAGYLCECIEGIEGRNCEINIEDCVEGACENNATCVDGINTFTCNCTAGYTGDRCQTEIDECALYSPCQNEAACTDLIADYSCQCLEFSPLRRTYGGKNCSVELIGCNSQSNCQNGGQCIPVLKSEFPIDHGYKCRCTAGFTGEFCELSTTVSFSSNGSHVTYTPPANPQQPIQVLSFRFRTTLTRTVLAVYAFSQERLVSVEIEDERLVVMFRDEQTPFQRTVASQEKVNNAEWHQVFLHLQDNVSLTLVSDACGSERCQQQFSYPRGLPGSTSSVHFGKFEQTLLDKTLTSQPFVGCLEDILYGDVYLFPGQQEGRYIGEFDEMRGCPRSEQCGPYTCKRHGTCVDLWDNFRCDCYRPYWGRQCEFEYTAATFFKDGAPSLATFDLNSISSAFSNSLNLSLFLRTRQANSVIAYFTNNGGSASATTFITIEIYDGYPAFRLNLCGTEMFYSEEREQINQGSLNFVRLTKDNSSIVLKVNGSAVVNATIPSSPCQFQASMLYFGRVPEVSGGRRRRQVSPPSLSQVDAFNGIIQDVQVQGYKLDFTQRSGSQEISTILLSSQVNVTFGAESTVSMCNTSMPCENGGACSDVFFNDFHCDCPDGYLGKNCSQPDFCENNSCPTGSRCQSLQEGFECISSATFDGSSSLVLYRPSDSIIARGLLSQRVSFMMRTRSYFGAIFEARAQREENKFIKIRIQGGSLEVNYQLRSSGFSESLHMCELVNDGQWYKVEMNINDRNDMTLRLSQNGTIVGEEGPRTLQDTVTNLTTLVTTGLIYVGDVADRKEQSFHGCLEEMRLGGVLLPFILDNTMINNNASERFSVTTMPSVRPGCQGRTDVCQRNFCTNQAACEDIWNDYECSCAAGYEGEFCSRQVNDCAAGGCLNGGLCLDGFATFTCTCPPAYTGTRCETPFDACANNSCDNGSDCVIDSDFQRGYYCNCSDQNYSGDFCNISIENTNCSDNLCVHSAGCTDNQTDPPFTCTCLPGYTGSLCESPIDYCSGLPCQNGTCTSNPAQQNYTCNCAQGFAGDVCETNIDDCTNTSCNGRGDCVDGVNNFTCECHDGWAGPQCQDNLDECLQSVCQHGLCEDRSPPEKYFCDCTGTGYMGKNCTVEVNECTHNFCPDPTTESCNNTEGSYDCVCKQGYIGDNCTEAICLSELCLNGSTCAVVEAEWGVGTQWKCLCQQYFGGERCDLAGPCVAQPCNFTYTDRCEQNDTVFDLPDPAAGNFTCVCQQGWEGDLCSEDVDECLSDHCQNGATCINLPGHFECTCVNGYTGDLCETDIDECEVIPCENGGVCTQGIGTFTCNCTGTGYEGITCSQDVDECAQGTPCNNGTCRNSLGSFSCLCGSEYLGDRCEYANPCHLTVCGNGGSCNATWHEDNQGYQSSCSCVNGFKGELCEQSPLTGDDDSINIAVIIGPIVGVILLIVIIAVIVFVMVARNKRATHGAYSPSRQETAGARVELGNVLKKPPEERLI